MKISYDAEVDALSITFLETTVTTQHLAEGIAADYDTEGQKEFLARVKNYSFKIPSDPRLLREVGDLVFPE